jgi:anti-anti-sigma factor
MKQFEINVKYVKENINIIVVSLKGEMEYQSIKCIHQTFKKINEKGSNLFVIVDFTCVISISSAAIGELMGCRTEIIEQDGDLVLSGLKLPVLEQIKALDADRIFKIYKDIQSAKNIYRWEYQNQIEHVSLSFPSKLTFVPPTRQMIRRIARQKGYSIKDAFRIETIVDEICNNAIEHGHKSKNNKVEVKIAIDRQKLEIRISNTSDPTKIASLKKFSEYLSKPDPFLNDMRGRGLALVKMLSSGFSVDNSEKETCVHVIKFREE